jgi:glycosyltransferase involved in cell wall biosynthesis
MRILVAHNAYQQRGGEDAVVDSEVDLLRTNGHAVELFSKHNDALATMGVVSAASNTLWSRRTYKQVAALLESFKPQVVHVHNTFPLISPSLYWACDEAKIPVVQTLHNFRLACPQAMFLREGKVCEQCIGKLPLPAVRYGCYRGSKAQSAVLTGMLALHRTMGTFQNKVTRYIALNEFCKGKFVESGLPASLIKVKPNFVDFPALPARQRDGFLFVGRLSPEKGVSVLADAWNKLEARSTLKVAGTGPEQALVAGLRDAALLGSLTQSEVHAEMASAVALVLPSVWYENFPRTLVEAMAAGLPIIASRIGALADLVIDGKTGLLFEPGNGTDLARKLAWAIDHPEQMLEMGRAARAAYDERYTPAINYQQLMAIYEDAIAAQRAS